MKNLKYLFFCLIPFINNVYSKNASADEPQAITVANGKMKINGTLQSWYYIDPTVLHTEPKDGMDLRRAEVKFSGNIIENTRWFLMLDFAKTLSSSGDNKVLQDLGLGITLLPNLELLVGQFKTPSITESFDLSSAELVFPERSYLARYIAERRDPGAMLSYKIANYRAFVMGSNGLDTSGNTATNRTETNRKKDIHTRIDGNFFDKQLLAGTFYNSGVYGINPSKRRQIYGADAKWSYKIFAINAAYMNGKDDIRKFRGFSTELQATILENFLLATRYERLTHKQPNLVGDATTFAFNYLIQKHNIKVQLAHSLLRNFKGSSGKYQFTSSTSPSSRNASTVTTLAVQMAF